MCCLSVQSVQFSYAQNETLAHIPRIIAAVAALTALVAMIVLLSKFGDSFGSTEAIPHSFIQGCFEVAKWSGIVAAALMAISLVRDGFSAIREQQLSNNYYKGAQRFCHEATITLLSPLFGAGFLIPICKK